METALRSTNRMYSQPNLVTDKVRGLIHTYEIDYKAHSQCALLPIVYKHILNKHYWNAACTAAMV